MKTKHTPGPWHVDKPPRLLGWKGDETGKVRDILSESGCLIATTNGYEPVGKMEGCGGDSLANAYLIAAAPDLLVALESMVAYAEAEIGLGTDEATGGTFCQARAAIAKAKKGG